MSIRIINGKVYKNGTFSEEDLVLKEGKISSAEDENADEVYDAKGKYVVPGFIDVHTHGGAGVDVNAADQQGFEKIGHFFATNSVIFRLISGCEVRRDTVKSEVASPYAALRTTARCQFLKQPRRIFPA